MFPLSIAGSVRFHAGTQSQSETVKAVTCRIAYMLYWVEARSIVIDGSRVTFGDNSWRMKAKSIVLLFDRGTLDVKTDRNRVRVRYRFNTTHQMIMTVLTVSIIGAVAAFGFHGPLHLKLLAALTVMAMGFCGLFGAFFISAKFYVPFWIGRGLRELPELQAKR